MKRVFRLPWTRRRIDADLASEFQFHLQGRIDQFVAAGMTRDEAEREAIRRFGDFEAYRQTVQRIDEETMHQQSMAETVRSMAREMRLAGRTLLRTPAFFFITVLTLALGIGATTAIFTLLDAVVLRPLPYRDADRLVRVTSPVPKLKGQTEWGVARHEMYYFLDNGRTLDAMGVYAPSEVTVLGSTAAERPERVRWIKTSASLFNVLGFTPRLGRLLVPEDNEVQLPTVVVLSHRYWQRRFGGDTTVVGRTMMIEGFPMRIVGVLDERQELPDITAELWAPAMVTRATVQNNHTWNAIGRMRPGVTADEAQRELASLTTRMLGELSTVYRKGWFDNTGFTTKVVSLRDAVVGDMLTRALWTLFGAVGLVMLIAMANVANLFLARLDARNREVAVRSALGAERSHLAAHYLSESMLIAGLAAAGALAIAFALLRVLVVIAPSELPRLSEVHLGWASVLCALGAALVAGIVFGVAPLFGRTSDLTVLREGGRGLLSSRRRMHVRRLLVASQMAFAVILLSASLLMVRTFQNLRGVQPGFDPTDVVTMQVALPQSKYGAGGDRYFESAAMGTSFLEQLATRVRELPGVASVGFGDRLPLLSGDWCTGISFEQRTREGAQGACPATSLVSPGYFETMGIRVNGRTSTWGSMHAGEGGVVVSRGFADHHWPNENAIGKGVRFNGLQPPFYRVIGVAEDVRSNGVDAPPVETVYFPVLPIAGGQLWSPPTNTNLVVRGNVLDANEFSRTVARLAAEIDAQVAISNPQTMASVLAHSVAKQSFTMALLAIAATIAMLLAAVGLYGVISYIVAQRRGEIGVRMALGAEASKVTGMVLRQSLRLATGGIVAGIVGAFAVTRLLRSLLFGVTPTDALTMAAVPVALVLVVLVASYAPARRASRISPIEALRSE